MIEEYLDKKWRYSYYDDCFFPANIFTYKLGLFRYIKVVCKYRYDSNLYCVYINQTNMDVENDKAKEFFDYLTGKVNKDADEKHELDKKRKMKWLQK